LKFKDWLNREVLPSIDETGSYHAPGVAKALPTDYISSLKALIQSEKEKVQMALDSSRVLALKAETI
jgi:prophage antirepressor-like protein